jgi:hypothetical protein
VVLAGKYIDPGRISTLQGTTGSCTVKDFKNARENKAGYLTKLIHSTLPHPSRLSLE